jgi:hypothetical protein
MGSKEQKVTRVKKPDLEPKKQRKKKRKIPLIYKVGLSVSLIALLFLGYFLILVSVKPTEIPFVTKKIEEVLQDKLGRDVAVGESLISFTKYGSLKVSVSGVQILYLMPEGERQSFFIPKFESEFPLWRILFLSFKPSKVKIVNPTITIKDLQKFEVLFPETSSENQTNPVIKILSLIRSGDISTKNFEIENAVIFLKGKDLDREILLKKSQIKVGFEGLSLLVSSSSKINFNQNEGDVDLNISCKMSGVDAVECSAKLDNFTVNSIVDFHPSLLGLSQINAAVKAEASVVIKNKKLEEVFFALSSSGGNFYYPNFFPNKIHFSDFLLSGKYNNNSGELSIFEAKSYLAGEEKLLNNKSTAPYLQAELTISDVRDLQSQKTDLNINLKNTPFNELKNLWPLTLSQSGIRAWVIESIKDGNLQNSHAKISLQNENGKVALNAIEAEVKFVEANLNYDEAFPAIKKIDGVAVFSKKGMKISLTSGDVLNSKISEGVVEIEDFAAKKPLLKIVGKSTGQASDSLKHVDHKSTDFVLGVEKYLNGNSQNEFEIRLPIGGGSGLKDVYMMIKSQISDLKNDHLKGNLEINCQKNVASDDFVANINLNAAEVNFEAFDIEKKAGIESSLSLEVAVKNSNQILIKNIELVKKDGSKSAKISGEFGFETSPFFLTSAKVINDDFGNNDYNFSYLANKKYSRQKISLIGKRINLAPLIEQKLFVNSSSEENFAKKDVKIVLGNVALAKNKALKSLYLSMGCINYFCDNFELKANVREGRLVDISSREIANDGSIAIEGSVKDIGYLAEAFGFSNTISGGDAELKLTNKIDGKNQFLQGVISTNKDITFYENATVKRLATDDLFSTIKDKIFSQNKTTFDSVKIEFSAKNGVINLQSLVANNYKIGVTAKGKIDMKNDVYEIKGMIVPGFIINNLFGIGKIPVLGSVVGILTGGEGGGLFGIRYEYTKNKGDKEAKFETSKVSSFVPTTIKSLFDLI